MISPTYYSNMESKYISGFVIVFSTNIYNFLYNECCKLGAFTVTVRAAESDCLPRGGMGGVWRVIPKKYGIGLGVPRLLT